MDRKNNIYQTLNKREKNILKILFVKEEELEISNLDSTIKHIYHQIDRISYLPVKREDVSSAIIDYGRVSNELFKGISVIESDEDYPKTKVNMYKLVSKKTRKTMKTLGIKVENKEITSKEYSYNDTILNNCILKYYGIKKRSFYRLLKKLNTYRKQYAAA